jgi:LacI family transcriptional regulator
MNERPRREKSRVGLREVASIAGVSTATVSRVINRPESVSEDLRTRVTMVIDQLGWVPNAAARALSSQRTGAIGAIFPALALGDFARAIDAMQDALAERNSLLLLARSKYDSGLEYSLVRKLAESVEWTGWFWSVVPANPPTRISSPSSKSPT